ncbi:hypothetical protein DXG01_004369 [Tephrocybe rancida]|nr:hypothetical protein DXG01_004369 [Tephrocybe rancida]
MAAFPKPNTIYRIQSSEFYTYLELWDDEEDLAVLRPLKDTKLQQWLFVEQGSKYKVLAAVTQSPAQQAYLTVSAPGEDKKDRPVAPPTAVLNDSSNSLWQVREDGDDYVLTTAGKAAGHETFLTVNSVGALDSLEKKTSRRLWKVDPQGNGKCFISSNITGRHIFLGWEKDNDGIAQVAIKTTPIEWFIKSLDEYTYS